MRKTSKISGVHHTIPFSVLSDEIGRVQGGMAVDILSFQNYLSFEVLSTAKSNVCFLDYSAHFHRNLKGDGHCI